VIDSSISHYLTPEFVTRGTEPLSNSLEIFEGKLKPRKCIICGEDYLNTRHPNKSMVCRNCKRVVKTRLHKLGAKETFRILIEKRGRKHKT